MGFLGFLRGSRKVTASDVIEVLEEIKIPTEKAKTEKSVEKLIYSVLEQHFEGVHCQYNIGGYLGLKVDIDIGDGEVGLELKLASALDNSAANVQRLFGQAIYYSQRKYGQNLIVVIVGDKKLKDKPFMKEIIDFLEDENIVDVYVYYLPTKSSRKKGV